jgi:hypothetical protein
MNITWESIEVDGLPKNNGKCPIIVSNNFEARNAYGFMSHVWCVDLIQYDEKEKLYIAYTEKSSKVYGITHYCEIE